MAGEAQRRSEWPLILSLLVAATGLVVLTFYNWRNGVLVFSGAVLLAGLLRATLTDTAAGLLHVRGRMFDTALLLGVGLAIGALGLVVPN
ncbi:DUF3017 domain-containing protein [Kribbella turkmenica]|uniref:DUF3017 domain-containing protein n=1 Tax=Kribbella turkmenica TaxID=2530375 RepID=A0A4R4XE15_9ACTN|nr:DUF3017 domain-containing protein [Kribbella turkmenica]TDD28953.1 DUF3017 domain-containing protein [Kribbella turkmenica]